MSFNKLNINLIQDILLYNKHILTEQDILELETIINEYTLQNKIKVSNTSNINYSLQNKLTQLDSMKYNTELFSQVK